MDSEKLAAFKLNPHEEVYEVQLDGDTFLVVRYENENVVLSMDYDCVTDHVFQHDDAPRALSYASWERVKRADLSGPPVGTVKSLGLFPISSEAMASESQAERFFRLSTAYLQSAKRLTLELRNNIETSGWQDACVIYYCALHSVELFYKAAILAKNPKEPISALGHSISKLIGRYVQLYPEREYQFRTLFDLTYSEVVRLTGNTCEPILEDFQEQLYRYMSDRQGKGPTGMHLFLPRVWLKWISEREEHWRSIWCKVQGPGN